jgi:ubiquitin carboxyl-terminal hydrolase 14
VDAHGTDYRDNMSGIYDLRGIITHHGYSPNSGRYYSYVKREALSKPQTVNDGDEETKWWFLNDEIVSMVDEEFIQTLSGGGMFVISFIVFSLDK